MTDTALIVSAIAPTPIDRGKRVFLNGLLEYFVERLGADNVHYAMVGGDPADDASIPGVVHHLGKPGTAAQLISLARCVGDRSYTAQQAMLGSPGLRAEIHALVDRVRPTVEVYDTIRLGQHAPAQPRARRRVLYLDDLFSVRYDRMLRFSASNAEVTFDPLGEFAENVPGFLRPVARRPAVYRALLRSERDRIQRAETAAVREFDVSLLVNDAEVQLLRRRSGVDTVELVHDLLPAVPEPVRRPVSPPELVFLGKLNLPHNDDAICTFLREAMPGVERRCPGALLRIVGSGAGETLRSLAAAHPDSVRLEGYVADLDAVFSSATVALAPMRMGSGIKLKMLDAFARGLPVLATSIAVDGIPVAPDGSDGCVISDDLAGWPDLVAELTEPERAEQLSAAALAFFAKTYGRDVVGAQYDKLFALGASRPDELQPEAAIPAQREHHVEQPAPVPSPALPVEVPEQQARSSRVR
jgi:glycosyltransferase involved in cell wall biosynthesis